jgi:hypothetical protein
MLLPFGSGRSIGEVSLALGTTFFGLESFLLAIKSALRLILTECDTDLFFTTLRLLGL